MGESPSLEYVWVKISALMIQLEEWESDRKFVGFLAMFQVEVLDLKAKYDRLAPTFQMLRGMVLEGTDRQNDRLAVYVQTELKERSAELLSGIYNFVSRGLLQCGATYGARAAALRKLGFDSRTMALKPKVTLDQLIILFLAIEGAMMASIVILAHKQLEVTFGQLLGQITMVSTMYTVAVLCAVYPKERWSFARKEQHTRPAASYVAAGLLATAASLVIRGAFLLMIYHQPDAAYQRFRLYSPWSLCAFVAAFLVAWMIDDAPTLRLAPKRLRWLEGLAGGCMLLLTSFMALQWMEGLTRVDEALRKIDGGQPPILALALGLPAAIGFGIGWLIPTWYRTAALEGRLGNAPAVEEQVPVAA